MPRLERRVLAIAEGDRPENRYFAFDVNARGEVLYLTGEEANPMFRIVDSLGHGLREFGRPGEGPGEVRRALQLRFEGDTIVVFASEPRKLAFFDQAGRPLGDVVLAPSVESGLPLAWVRDSFDAWRRTDLGELNSADRVAYRYARQGGEGRRLVGREDSIVASTLLPEIGNSPMIVPYTATDDRFWVGDGWGYRIRAFSVDGTPLFTIQHSLPPARMGPKQIAFVRASIERQPRYMHGPNGEAIALPDRHGRLDTLGREVIPHFGRFPLHADHHGRLWVIGSSRDSITVDVFRDSTWMGRQSLPCVTRAAGTNAALGPGWLLLECEVDEGDWPTELQLYRVIEQ
jgi:hypothetical protein